MTNKTLIIVDVQPSFLNTRNQYIVRNILNLLANTKYNLYIESTFHAEKGSIWEKQQDWICPMGEETQTIEEIAERLKELKAIHVEKETKSVFKGQPCILPLLKQHTIQEIHIVGLDTNDCVLATAYESFDLGFLTYVIETCCESSSSAELHEQALAILRGQNMTDRSAVRSLQKTLAVVR